MKKQLAALIFSGMVSVSCMTQSSMASTVSYSDFEGTYGMNHDGWHGTLALDGRSGDSIEGIAPITGIYTGENGNEHGVRGHVRTATYMLPESWGPDHKIAFYVDFNDTEFETSDDQAFEGYLFGSKDAMAGITWWQGTPFGFYLNRGELVVSDFTTTNGTPVLSDFTGTYAMNHDGWKGTLELEAGTGDFIEQMPNIIGTYTAETGEQHSVRGFVGYQTQHKIVFYVDFNDTDSHYDDQEFEGYLFGGKDAIAGKTYWSGTPFGFYCIKEGDQNDDELCVRINEDLTIEVSCMQFGNDSFETTMVPVSNPVRSTLPIWKVTLPDGEFKEMLNTVVMDEYPSTESERISSQCLNDGGELEKEDTLYIPCAEFAGMTFGFEMIRFSHPNDPEGLYLELDPDSIR